MIAAMNLAEASVLRTLIYAHVFDAGVRRSELKRWLLSPVRLSSTELARGITGLKRAGKLVDRDGWLFLSPGPSDQAHRLRSRESQAKLRQALSLIARIAWLPSILGIGVTGSVAVGNARASEDIDLLIITRSGFLWSTRLIVSAVLFADGSLRRRRERRVTNKLCLNLWLDEAALSLPKQSLYVARELAQVHWLLNREQVRERLWQQNPWSQAYLGVKPRRAGKRPLHPGWAKLFSPLEQLCFKLQWLRMHPTREIVDAHRAFFHPRNTGGQVMRRYQQLCRRYNVDSLVG